MKIVTVFLIFFLLLLIFSDNAFAQRRTSGTGLRDTSVNLIKHQKISKEAPILSWQQTYGGLHQDMINSVLETKDGGFIMAGSTNSKGAGGEDMWLLKTDQQGNMEWETTFGGAKNDGINSIVETKDGGFALAGYTESKGSGKHDMWVIRTDKKGQPVWEKVYGESMADEANSIIQTKDGNFVLVGYSIIPEDSTYEKMRKVLPYTQQQIWVIKTNDFGEILWKKEFMNEHYNSVHSVLETNEGNLYIAANTLLKDKMVDTWLIKTDAKGELIWESFFGGKRWDTGNSIIETADGGCVLAGTTNSDDIRGDMWILKVNRMGGLEWEKTFGTDEHETASSLIQTEDGGFVMSVNVTSKKGISDVWMLVKTDQRGNLVWYKVFGNNELQKVNALIEAKDGGLVLVGTGKKIYPNSNEVVQNISLARLHTTDKVKQENRQKRSAASKSKTSGEQNSSKQIAEMPSSDLKADVNDENVPSNVNNNKKGKRNKRKKN